MSKHMNFDEMVSLKPEFGPLNATEDPTPEEVAALDDVNAEVTKFLYGDNNASVLGMIGNAQELYLGVSQAAFQILLATKQKFEAGGTKLPSAVLFGEGGAIHSTIDEMFQLAQAANIPGSEDQDQYNASMMNVMKLAGDYIEQTKDDSSVEQAQELLVDIESTGDPNQAQNLTQEDDQNLQGAIQRSLDTQNQALQPQQAPPQGAGGQMPQDPSQGQPQMPPQQQGVLGNVG